MKEVTSLDMVGIRQCYVKSTEYVGMLLSDGWVCCRKINSRNLKQLRNRTMHHSQKNANLRERDLKQGM